MLIGLSAIVVVLAVGFIWHRRQIRMLEEQYALRLEHELSSRHAEYKNAIARADDLTVADRAKTRILTQILNEVRTPLMMLMAPLQRVVHRAMHGGDGWDSEREQMYEHALQIKHYLGQVGGILDLELDGADLDLSEVDVIRLLGDQVRALLPSAERHGLHVSFEANVDEVWMTFDPDKIERALHGILTWVFDDTEATDAVQIVATRRPPKEGLPDRLVLQIDDPGKVMGAPYARLLQDDTHWVDEETTLNDHVGLALALTRAYVRIHDGDIMVASDEDNGTRVQIILPIRHDAPRHSRQASEAPQVSEVEMRALFNGEAIPPQVAEQLRAREMEVKDTKVLVVDDHEGIRGYLSFALRRYHQVLEASNGQEALALIEAEKPDLVLSDVVMPVMDGHTLCKTVKGNDELSDIPVVLITANDIPNGKHVGLGNGADDYLVKPFDLEEAIIKINNMIKMRKQMRNRFSREVLIKPSNITVTSAEEAFVERAIAIVEQEMDNSNFGVQELAKELGLSPRQLQRRLRETADQSPVEFIRSLRLQRAAQLLEGQAGNVSEVAYSVGFTSLSYFAKCFREQFGSPPSEYKAECLALEA